MRKSGDKSLLCPRSPPMAARSLPLPLSTDKSVEDPEATPTARSTLAALSTVAARESHAFPATSESTTSSTVSDDAARFNLRKGKHRQMQNDSTSLVSALRTQLCEYATQGRLQGVIDILHPDVSKPSGSCTFDDYPSAFALVNSHTASGSTPLLEAATSGQLQIVQYLLEQEGAIRDLEDYDGESAFLRASWAGHLEIMQYLVHGSYSESVNTTFKYQYGENEKKPSVMPGGTDVNCTDRQGWTAMHNAASKGHLAIVMWLCSLPGADVSAINEQGYTPLMNAASKGHMPVARFLLSRGGADPFLVNRYNESALDIAIACRELGIADYIAQFEESMWSTVPAQNKEVDSKAELASNARKGLSDHEHSAANHPAYLPLQLHKVWHIVVYEQEVLSGKWLASQRHTASAIASNSLSMFSKSGMSTRHGHSAWELPPSYKGINDSREYLAVSGRKLRPPRSANDHLTLETENHIENASTSDDLWGWQTGWFLDLSLHNVEVATGWQYATSFDASESEWTAHIPDGLASLLLAPSSGSHQTRRNSAFVRRRRWARIMSRHPKTLCADESGTQINRLRPIKLLPYNRGESCSNPPLSLVDESTDYLTRAKYFAGLRVSRAAKQRQSAQDCEKAALEGARYDDYVPQEYEQTALPDPSTIELRSAARLRPKLELALAELAIGTVSDSHEGRATEAEELKLRLEHLLEELPRGHTAHAGVDAVWNDNDADSSSDSASVSTSARSNSIYSPLYSPRSVSPVRSISRTSAAGSRPLTAPFNNVSLAAPTLADSFRQNSLRNCLKSTEARAWQPDNEVRACPTCSRTFKLWFRKHHCRLCGEIRCDDCSSNQDYLSADQVVLGPDAINAWEGIAFVNGGGIYRTCDTCHSALQTPAQSVEPALLLPALIAYSSRSNDMSREVSRSSSAEHHAVVVAPVRSPGTLQRSMSNLSEVSAMADCPVCGADLQQLEDKIAQELHIQTCLESGSTVRRQETRYLVFELPDLSPLVGSDCLICFETYTAGDRIGRLTCLCTFHRDCIAGWLSRGKACPVHAQ